MKNKWVFLVLLGCQLAAFGIIIWLMVQVARLGG